ncbi:MAG: membrane protein insertion efficiency factor YidD [Gammaproteobacteria bacterium]
MRTLILSLIRFYQVAISPMFGPHCRYYPTCSSYAQQAVTEYGALRGGWMALKRLGRCHPWCEGGIDDVPARPNPADKGLHHG